MKRKAYSKKTAIIIGAGHNGLACAYLLAQAGFRVVVYEQRPTIGGACVTERPFGDEYLISSCAYVYSLMPPELAVCLGIPDSLFVKREKFSATIDLNRNGNQSLVLGHDMRENIDAIARFSYNDACIYPKYEAFFSRIGPVIRNLFLQYPLSVKDFCESPAYFFKEAYGFLKRIGPVANLRFGDIPRTIRMVRGSAIDFLDDWGFESDILRRTLVTDGIIGSVQSPAEPGTGYVYLHHAFGPGAWKYVRGGMGAIPRAMIKSAYQKGYNLDVQVNRQVTRIIVKNGTAIGVELDNAEMDFADYVVSAIHPIATFSRLVDKEMLNHSECKKIENWKSESGAVKVNVVLSRLPRILGITDPKHMTGTIHLTSSLQEILDSYKNFSRGTLGRKLVIEATIPSLSVDKLAPSGEHIMGLFVQYVPSEGYTREEILGVIWNTVARFMPDIRSCILYQQLIHQRDLEKNYGMRGGNIFLGNLEPGQILNRFTRKTSIARLFLSGAGTGPGGVTAIPGLNTARSILKQRIL